MTDPGQSGRTPTPAERWKALAPGWRAVLALVALFGGGNVVLAGVQRVTGGSEPGGQPSSSYATAPEGVAAYADLLAGERHPVHRLREGLDKAGLLPATTLVLLEPRQLEDSETEALERFVQAGGRLVVAGQEGAPLLRRLLGERLAWASGGAERATPLAPVPETSGVASVRASGRGSWRSVGSALPVLAAPRGHDAPGGPEDGDGPGRDGGVLGAVAMVGEGRVVLVADAGVFQNRLLGEDDNAAFAIAAVGAPGRPVSFAEAAHGYTEGEGLSALPSRWRWALGATAVAALVWMWSRGKRFGPPEEVTRDLPPPRRAYVDAVAATVARSREPDAAVEPLRGAARQRLCRRASLPTDAGDVELIEAARRLGGDPGTVARLLAPVNDDDDLMGAGRAASWVLGKP